MPMEKKKKTLEQKAFNKRFKKVTKLWSPKLEDLSKNVGKAPSCNTSTVKKEVPLTVVYSKKKK